MPGVEYVRIDLPFGSPFGASLDSTTTRVGTALVTANDPESLEQRRSELLRWFDERLVVPAGAPTAGLRDWQRGLGEQDDFADVDFGG